MKRTFIILFLVTFIVAGAAFGVARWLRCRSCAAPAKPDLVRELNLTSTQAAEIAKIDAAYEKHLADICVAHCAARTKLANSLTDRTKADVLCAQMCAAQADSEKAALERIFQIRAVLTPAQQQKYIAVVQQQLTSSCPMPVKP